METTPAPAAAETTLPTTRAEERKLEKDIGEEYHGIYDGYSVQDTLLSLVPFIVIYAFKDVSLQSALAFAIAFSAYLLVMRTMAYDSRKRMVWPLIEITTLITAAILRGLMRHYTYWIHKWIPVILPLALAVVGLLSLAWRRPFIAHYGRYPKFDKSGRGLWQGDRKFRLTTDLIMIAWISAWSIMLLLSLIPILIGKWFTWHALNTIFNYIIPYLCLAAALVFQQVMGHWYQRHATKAAASTETGYRRGAGPPSGVSSEMGTAPPATYSTEA